MPDSNKKKYEYKCGLIFHNRRYDHKINDTGGKTECDICGLKFSTSGGLATHKLSLIHI